MNLQETIAQLEQQAAKYTQAADALRALLPQGESLLQEAEPVAQEIGEETSQAAEVTKRKYTKKQAEPPQPRKTRNLSPETRAKMSENMRARQQQKREARERQAQEGTV